MRIRLNGADRELEPGSTIAMLLAQLGLDPRFLAVERNRELVPRAQHTSCVLRENDELEVVTLVGGG